MINNKFGKKSEVLRSDNGGKCINNEMENYLRQNAYTTD